MESWPNGLDDWVAVVGWQIVAHFLVVILKELSTALRSQLFSAMLRSHDREFPYRGRNSIEQNGLRQGLILHAG